MHIVIAVCIIEFCNMRWYRNFIDFIDWYSTRGWKLQLQNMHFPKREPIFLSLKQLLFLFPRWFGPMVFMKNFGSRVADLMALMKAMCSLRVSWTISPLRISWQVLVPSPWTKIFTALSAENCGKSKSLLKSLWANCRPYKYHPKKCLIDKWQMVQSTIWDWFSCGQMATCTQTAYYYPQVVQH